MKKEINKIIEIETQTQIQIQQEKKRKINNKFTVRFANEPQKWRFPAWKTKKEFEKNRDQINNGM